MARGSIGWQDADSEARIMHDDACCLPAAAPARPVSRRRAALAWLAAPLLAPGAWLAGCAGTPAAPPPLPAAAAKDIVLVAMNFLDAPYRRGGTAETGFDCSGFTRHVYERSLGLALPRTAAEQARHPALAAVPRAALQPGDLVFFNTLALRFSHVGIYVGEGRFIHAPRPGTAVRLEDMDGPGGRYWAPRYDGARRPRGPARALPEPAAGSATGATIAPHG
jgi:cell wall-associated NlpC family hydrolase